MLPEIAASSKTFSEAFSAAERAIKRFERLDGNTLMPAINQLRYAGSHYTRAENATESSTATAELSRALAHCRRAEYDAIEGAVIVLGKQIVGFNSRFWPLRPLPRLPRPRGMSMPRTARMTIPG